MSDPADVVIAVDIGTTATKSLAYGAGATRVAEARREYPLLAPGRGRAEQDPEQIVDAVVAGIAELSEWCRSSGARVAAVAFSAAMHSIMAVDGSGEPLTPAITWADNRAADQAQRLRRDEAGAELYRRTGTPIHPMSPLLKLMWFAEREPEIHGRAARWLSLKEYVLHRLLGEYVVDHSIASATGMLALQTLDWDDRALALAGVRRSQLSLPVPATFVLSGLEEGLATRLGLDPATPFVVGASDGALANLGVGAIRPGIAAASIGTSGALRMCSDHPLTDERGLTFCYALADGLWVLGGAINNGGAALAWARDLLFYESPSGDEDPFAAVLREADRAPAGAEGLVFLPYLLGERSPHWNPDARGVLFGLSLRHGRAEVVRAVMEGVTLQMLTVLTGLETICGPARECRATGGFARSRLWRQIMADVFAREVAFPDDHEGSCRGAAMLGMRAVGILGSLQESEALVGVEVRHEPMAPDADVYRAVVPLFESLYESLEPRFGDLARMRGASA